MPHYIATPMKYWIMEGVDGEDGMTEYEDRKSLVDALRQKSYAPSLIAQIVVRLEYVGPYVSETYPIGDITEIHTEWSFRSRLLEHSRKAAYDILDAEYLIRDWIDAGVSDVND